jgi:hypothetical protein
MKHFAFAVTVVLVAACATTPKTPAQLLVGTWTCESKSNFGSIKSAMTYAPDGKAGGEMSVAGTGNPTMLIEAAGKVDGSWKLLENDTKLEQTLANVTVTSAKLNSQAIDPKMAQAMLGSSLAGQSTTTAIKIDAASMTLTSEGGDITSCTR